MVHQNRHTYSTFTFSHDRVEFRLAYLYLPKQMASVGRLVKEQIYMGCAVSIHLAQDVTL